MSITRKLQLFAATKFKVCGVCGAFNPTKQRRCYNCKEKPIWHKPNPEQIKQYNVKVENFKDTLKNLLKGQ